MKRYRVTVEFIMDDDSCLEELELANQTLDEIGDYTVVEVPLLPTDVEFDNSNIDLI